MSGWSVYTEVEITAPPEVVRAKFLDFSQIPIYSPEGPTHSIIPQDQVDPLAIGKKLNVSMKTANFVGTIVINNDSEFSWTGGVPYVIAGVHRFKFLPSQRKKGHTLFVQEENFSGVFGLLFANNWLGRNLGMGSTVMQTYNEFNADFARSFS